MAGLERFDALTRSMEDGVDCPILDPSGIETGLVIKVASYESERAKKEQRRIANTALKRQRRNLTAEEIEVNQERLVASVMVSWTFGKGPDGEQLTIDGRVPEFNPEEVRKLLKRFPWIMQQVDDKAGERTNFLES